jgi:hypothetical protein
LNGVGSVYAELKKIYGVSPDEKDKYNLLLHNFGVYHKDDQPLFEQDSCVPKNKDVVKQILELGRMYLTAKKNATRSLNSNPLRNKPLVDAQIPILKKFIEKLDTMGESPVCDITQGAPQPPATVPTVGKLGPAGPVPNCLQDTKMLQSFLNMLTLMMGIMSDDDKRKNLKAVNLKDILAIGTKDPKNVTDANRQVVSAKIEQLLNILQTVSTTDVNAPSDIEDFLKALKEDEDLKEISNTGNIAFPERLEDVLEFFHKALEGNYNITSGLFEKELNDLRTFLKTKEEEINQIKTLSN